MEIGIFSSMRHSLNFWRLNVGIKRWILLDSFKCFVMKKNGIFFNFNIDSRISLLGGGGGGGGYELQAVPEKAFSWFHD